MTYQVTKSDAEWREQLSRDEYQVLRKAGTEAPFVGESRETVGGTFPPPLTVTFTTVDVAERPRLSVATAVSAWPPAARLTVIV